MWVNIYMCIIYMYVYYWKTLLNINKPSFFRTIGLIEQTFTKLEFSVIHDRINYDSILPKSSGTSRSLVGPPPCEQGSMGAYWTHETSLGKWPKFCSFTGQDSSKERNLEGIGQVVVEFYRP